MPASFRLRLSCVPSLHPPSSYRSRATRPLVKEPPMHAVLLAVLPALLGQAGAKIKVVEAADHVLVETDALQARIAKKGYVSGIAAGSLLDKKTGARDLGFGLHIMDFLLAPGWKDDGYTRDKKLHGDLPKHYIEGPQICTKARKLDPEVTKGDGW